MKTLFVLLFSLLTFNWALAADFMVVEGRLTDALGNSIEDASPGSFTLKILDPTESCLLYEEVHPIGSFQTDGYFSFKLGSQTQSNGVATNFLSAILNDQPFAPSAGCGGGYSPLFTDGRKLVIDYTIGAVNGTLSAIDIGSSAYAASAASIDGLMSGDLLHINPGIPDLNQTNLETLFSSPNWIELQALLNGSSTSFAGGYTFDATELDNVHTGTGILVRTGTATYTSITDNSSLWDMAHGWGDHAVAGYLTAVNGTTLNNGMIWVGDASNQAQAVAMSGDATLANNGTLTLVNSGVTSGTYGSATQIPTITVDAQGRVTSVATNAASITETDPGLQTLTATQIDQFENIGATTISAAQWGYLGSMVAAAGTGDFMADGSVPMTAPLILVDDNSASCVSPGDASQLRYNAGSLQFCNGSTWQTLGVSGAGLTSLNGQTGNTQTFAAGSAGTAPAINSAGDVHTLNIPLASGPGVTSGTISNTDFNTFNNKVDRMGDIMNGQLDITGTNDEAQLVVRGASAQSVPIMEVRDFSNQALLVVRDIGDIGIGTDIPARQLHIESGSMRMTPAPLPGGAAAGDIAVDSGDANKLKYYDGSSWVDAGGNSGYVAGDTILADNGAAAIPGFAFNTDSDTGFFSSGGDEIGVATAGTERVRINSIGNVGIGSTTPAYPLDVVGVIRSSTDIHASQICDETGTNCVDISAGFGGSGDFLADGSVIMTGQFVLNNSNSPGIPDLTFASDTDTGLFQPVSDSVSISAGGAEAFRADPTAITSYKLLRTQKNIGTTYSSSPASMNPLMKLENSSNTDNSYASLALTTYNSNADEQSFFLNAVSSTGVGVYSPSLTFVQKTGASAHQERMRIDDQGRLGVGTDSPTGHLEVMNNSSSTNIADFKDSSGISTMIVKNNGRVGVRQASPSANLHVDGQGLDSIFLVRHNSTQMIQVTGFGAPQNTANVGVGTNATANSRFLIRGSGVNVPSVLDVRDSIGVNIFRVNEDGTSSFSGNTTINGDLTVTGNITAAINPPGTIGTNDIDMANNTKGLITACPGGSVLDLDNLSFGGSYEVLADLPGACNLTLNLWTGNGTGDIQERIRTGDSLNFASAGRFLIRVSVFDINNGLISVESYP